MHPNTDSTAPLAPSLSLAFVVALSLAFVVALALAFAFAYLVP
jgi:hypothetical protein